VPPDPVFCLDLCILAYQLHSQTLVWPLDPYAEVMKFEGISSASRRVFLDKVEEYLRRNSVRDWRGPAFLGGAQADRWIPNPDVDPIIGDYTRMSLDRYGFAMPYGINESVINYKTPDSIVDPIGSAFVVSYDQAPDFTNLTSPCRFRAPQPIGTRQGANQSDLLYCFEGATGINSAGGGAWSLMGYALARHDNGQRANPFDVYIVFRGSRSGKMSRGRGTAYWGGEGNPDWVTDMGFGHDGINFSFEVMPDFGQSPMHRGFARAMMSMLPIIFQCLDLIHQNRQVRPRAIYVCGHSLGGALASTFASAVGCGLYRNGRNMPPNVAQWPWNGLSVISFSAPPIGGDHFAGEFRRAITNRRNIFVIGDPIPMVKGTHQCDCVPLNHPETATMLGVPVDGKAHEPARVREALEDYSLLFAGRAKDGFEPWIQRATIVAPGFDLRGAPLKVCESFKRFFAIVKTVLGEKNFPQDSQASIDKMLVAFDGLVRRGGSATTAQVIALYNSFLSALELLTRSPELKLAVRMWLVLVFAELTNTWPTGQNYDDLRDFVLT